MSVPPAINVIISEAAATAQPVALSDAAWVVVLVTAAVAVFLLGASLPHRFIGAALMSLSGLSFPVIAFYVLAGAGPFAPEPPTAQQVVSAALTAALEDYPGAVTYDDESSSARLIDPNGATCEYAAVVTLPAEGAHGIASLYPGECSDNYVGPDVSGD